ncbi:MAG: ATP-binding cassette domain-containing protein [Bacteroidia bacterium]|nr:ATP-binding cassette domain-containing protein [Bacteroidia bacterium]
MEHRANYKLLINKAFKLLRHDRRIVIKLLIYAALAGALNLTLPLGIQSIIGLIMGARMSASLTLLIGIVIFGTLFAGWVTILQMQLAEHLQQKIFQYSVTEFSYKIPRIKMEALRGKYAPSFVNRFLDTTTIQKALPKILLDLSAAVLQIIFCLILLSVYHISFIVFSILMFLALVLLLRATGMRAIDASIAESKYKYRILYWLQEVSRALGTFKLAGGSKLPNQKSEELSRKYFHYRKKRFFIQMRQYWIIISFKTIITGALLILGAGLVLKEQINLGQFVASEIIIILLLNAVEKLIINLDSIYDVLTAVEKLSSVTDLELEEEKGMRLSQLPFEGGAKVDVSELSYKIGHKQVLEDIHFTAMPGERVAITGMSGSGKSTLLSIIPFLYHDYDGVVSINDISIRNLNPDDMRSMLDGNYSHETIFYGTVEENIRLSRPDISIQRMLEVCERLDLLNFIKTLPEGFDTKLIYNDANLPKRFVEKIILARNLVESPSLLLLEDFSLDNFEGEGDKIMKILNGLRNETTIIATTNDLAFARQCDKILLLEGGRRTFYGSVEEGLRNPVVLKNLY